MLGLARSHRQRAEAQRTGSVVLAELEGVLEVARAADTPRKGEELIGRARRHHDAQPFAAGQTTPRVHVAERDEVEHVIGVHVADDHRVELRGVVAEQQLGDDAGADVDQDAGAAALDEVAGAGLARIGASR